jgi:hypothetical protein
MLAYSLGPHTVTHTSVSPLQPHGERAGLPVVQKALRHAGGHLPPPAAGWSPLLEARGPARDLRRGGPLAHLHPRGGSVPAVRQVGRPERSRDPGSQVTRAVR